MRRSHGSCSAGGSYCGRDGLSHLHDLPEGTREHRLWSQLLPKLYLWTLGGSRGIPELGLHMSPLQGSSSAKESAA